MGADLAAGRAAPCRPSSTAPTPTPPRPCSATCTRSSPSYDACARRPLRARARASAARASTSQPRVWFNPELRSTQFLVPGLIGFILMLTAVALDGALGGAREGARHAGAAARHALRTAELIVGKTHPLPRHLAARHDHRARSRRGCCSACTSRGRYLAALRGEPRCSSSARSAFGLLISTLVATAGGRVPDRGHLARCCRRSCCRASSSRSAPCRSRCRSSPTSCRRATSS